MRKTAIFLLPVKNLPSPSCSPTPISHKTREFRWFVNIYSGGFRDGRNGRVPPPPFSRVIRKFFILIIQRLWCNFLYSVPHFRFWFFRLINCICALSGEIIQSLWELSSCVHVFMYFQWPWVTPNYPKPPHFCHKLALYENGLTDRAHFWHRGFPWLILHCVGREFGYLQK